MKRFAVVSYPRSGQSILVNALYCLDPIWTEVATAKKHLLKPNNCFVNNEADAVAVFKSRQKHDDTLEFLRGHDIPKPPCPFVQIVRDPRDIICSYARFCVHTYKAKYEEALKRFVERNHWPHYQNTWPIWKWPDSVTGWMGHKLCAGTVRYEDLIVDPLSRCMALLENAGWHTVKIRDYPTSEHLSKLSPWYYKRQKFGVWKTEMPPEMAEKIRQQYGSVMDLFGYE